VEGEISSLELKLCLMKNLTINTSLAFPVLSSQNTFVPSAEGQLPKDMKVSIILP
jgi:hypothetical protein